MNDRLRQAITGSGAGYSEIAAELRVTKASLHYHFPSKSSLGERLVERYREAFLEALTAMPPASGAALGFDRLSMPPAGIGPVKQMVLSCDREAARRGVSALLKGVGGSVRNEIETLARKLYVAI